jgi:lambda family phage portal protein
MAGLAYSGATNNRFLSDWVTVETDPNDDFWRDARSLRSRAWHLYNNDPIARALVETLVGGTIDPTGIKFQSSFQEDDDVQTTDEENGVRRSINKYIERASCGTNLDAAGMLSFREMNVAIEVSKIIAGDGFAIRLWKPERPGAVTGTCWRVIDPARVSNPGNGENTPTLFEGIELNADGSPIAIHIRDTHPNMQRLGARQAKPNWTRVPIYAEDGSRLVLHRKSNLRPDQLRGVSQFSPFLTDLRHLSELKNAYIVAKRMQASTGMVVKTDDPEKSARADKNGALLSGTVGMKPGFKYYTKKENDIVPFNTTFQGAEFEEMVVTLVQNIAASWALPVEMVLRRLTKTNLASSRAALMDFYETCRREQEEHIAQVSRPMVEALIREGVARGDIVVPKTEDGLDYDRLSTGSFQRPPRFFPDPLKEVQAAQGKIAMGASRTKVFADLGLAFEDEIARRAQDEAYMEAQGVDLNPAPTVEQENADAADKGEADSESDTEDDKPADKTAASQPQIFNIPVTIPAPQVHIQMSEPKPTKTRIVRDDKTGRITGTEPVTDG